MKLHEKILRIMQEEQISVEELMFMVEHAAKTSLRGCNRRYHHWLFLVEGEVLKDMQYAEGIPEVGNGLVEMMEDHLPCQGRGCKACAWSGSIIRKISDTTAISLDKRSA